MESKLLLFDQVKELPNDGYCIISGEDSSFLQRMLFRKGYIWPGRHPQLARDTVSGFTGDIILWWRFYEGEKQPIQKKLNRCTSLEQVSHICEKVEFSDYFKPKPEFEGYLHGRQFGI